MSNQGIHKVPPQMTTYHNPMQKQVNQSTTPELDFLKSAFNRIFEFASELRYSEWQYTPQQLYNPY